uniref:Uncharacterized protein n=1 Tax=Timema shepardi TaxID=629360 RepID=A0A7R9B824_TIMSH|nr:unnamed protein product [Timema shepardi]
MVGALCSPPGGRTLSCHRHMTLVVWITTHSSSCSLSPSRTPFRGRLWKTEKFCGKSATTCTRSLRLCPRSSWPHTAGTGRV